MKHESQTSTIDERKWLFHYVIVVVILDQLQLSLRFHFTHRLTKTNVNTCSMPDALFYHHETLRLFCYTPLTAIGSGRQPQQQQRVPDAIFLGVKWSSRESRS
jgi:hypothetical protein